MSKSLEVMRTELTAAVASAAPGVAAADQLCQACVGVLEVDGAAVSLITAGTVQGTFGSSDELGRRLDEYQFTYGEGPCLDAVARRSAVLVPDLDSPYEQRWPAFTGAVLSHGIRGVFAMPIMVESQCVGALDLFRGSAGPLGGDQLAGAALAANLASGALLDALDDSEPDPEIDSVLGLDRIEVYQATGFLISQLGVSADEALVRLRAHAVATDQTASEVAWAVLDGRVVLEVDNHDGTGGTPGGRH